MIDGASKQHRNGAWRLLEPAYSPFPSPICPVLRPTSCSDSGISPLAGRIHAPFWLLWLQLPGPGSGPCAGRVGQPRRRAGGRRGGRMRDRVSVRDRHIPQPRRVCMRMSAGCHDGPWGGSARSRSAQIVVLERPETVESVRRACCVPLLSSSRCLRLVSARIRKRNQRLRSYLGSSVESG